MEIFGFYGKGMHLLSNVDSHYEQVHMKVQNGLNVVGWIPLLGTLTGLLRLVGTAILHASDENEAMHMSYYIMSGIRSGIEICSAGCIFIIPDVIATIIRKCKIKKSKVAKKKSKKIPKKT